MISTEEGNNINENENLLSVCWSGEMIGLTVYTEGTLKILADTQEINQFKVFLRAFLQIRPSKIIFSNKDKFRVSKSLIFFGNCEESLKEILVSLPNVDFGYQSYKSRLHLLNFSFQSSSFSLDSSQRIMTESEMQIFYSTLFSSNQPNAMRSLGGLLKFMESKVLTKNRLIEVLAVKPLILQEFLVLDAESYKNLQLMLEESHPSSLVINSKKIERRREGFSLFSLLNRCKSSVGSKLLKEWFLYPLSNLECIIQRQEVVQFLSHVSNSQLSEFLQNHLKHIFPLVPLLRRMTQNQGKLGDWKVLIKVLLSSIQIYEILSSSSFPHCQLFMQLKSDFEKSNIIQLTSHLSNIIDLESKKTEGRFSVKSSIHPELDAKRRTLQDLDDLIESGMDAHKQIFHLDLSSSIVFIPQVGFLLCVNSNDQIIHPQLVFMFHANGNFFYRTLFTNDLDEKYGDLMCDVEDIELRYEQRIREMVLKQSEILLSIIETLAELDCLLSFACVARMNGYVRPRISQSNLIRIKGLRHPLLEQLGTFVPNDITSCSLVEGSSEGLIKLILGANCSGKSVYLKQIGIAVFMTQIGSFVACEEAELGLMNQLSAKFAGVPSNLLGLSTFFSDIEFISKCLATATERSLILIDEFAKGTHHEDGKSILSSLLKYASNLGSKSPHLLISTHFTYFYRNSNNINKEISDNIDNKKKYISNNNQSIESNNSYNNETSSAIDDLNLTIEVLPSSPPLQIITMQVILEIKNKKEEITYLYKALSFSSSSSSSSYPFQVASMIPLPIKVLKRTSELLHLKNNFFSKFSNFENWSLKDEEAENFCCFFMNYNFQTQSSEDFLQIVQNNFLQIVA